MKHSPGKWEAEFVGHGGPGDNPEEVWEVNNGHARIAEYMTEADARLIAAAPELLAALRSAVAIIESMGADASKGRAAIAKATQSNI